MKRSEAVARVPGVGGKESRLGRDRMIEDNLGLVKYIAYRIKNRHNPPVDIDDLIGAGMLGLIDAVDRFRPEHEVRFSTYAEHRIRGAILDFIRQWSFAPRKVWKRCREVEQAVQELEAQLGHAPDEEEIAARLGIELGEYQRRLVEFQGIKVLPLNNEPGEGEGVGMVQFSHPGADPLTQFEEREVRERLGQAVSGLPQREQMVLALYYREELTFREIAQVFDLTESRICQIHTQAVLRLRGRLKSLAANDSPEPAMRSAR